MLRFGDDVDGQVSELDVGPLRGPTQYVEGFVRAHPALGHDDPFGLLDRGHGFEARLQPTHDRFLNAHSYRIRSSCSLGDEAPPSDFVLVPYVAKALSERVPILGLELLSHGSASFRVDPLRSDRPLAGRP